MRNEAKVKWLDAPEAHNYPAAFDYLSLVMEPYEAWTKVQKLQKVDLSYFKAKDIFRASGLSLLGVSNHHVEKDLKKIKEGEALSPILLVRDPLNARVIIADGYHRLCAVYMKSEDAEIPCKIV